MWWTIIASAIGSITALAIAFGAYPWQKRKDRQLQISLEQRKAYTDILRSIHRFRNLVDDLKFDSPETLGAGINELFEASADLEEEVFVISAISEKTIFQEICQCNETLRGVYYEIARELQDLLSADKQSYEKVEVVAAFQSARERAYSQIDKATNELVSVVRARAFGLDGKIELTSRLFVSQKAETR